jgi:hypothetical protein
MSKRRRQGKKNENVVKVVTLPTDPEHERRIDALIEERAAERDEQPELRASERDEEPKLRAELDPLPIIETTATIETAVLKYLEGSSEFDAMLPAVSA